ncbi:MAG: terminase large subunit domain-containing protein, partial [Pikeienuella sp.]
MTSTSTPPEKRSTAAFIASLPPDQVEEFLADLSPNAVASLPFLFEVWGHPGHQLPPAGDWITWLILGGRGAGKTRAGSEWIRAQVEGATPQSAGKCSRIALIAETIDQAVEIMIRGDSGILACTPDDRRPEYIATRKALIWP